MLPHLDLSSHVWHRREEVVVLPQDLLHVDEPALVALLAAGAGAGVVGGRGHRDERDVEGVEGATRLTQRARIAQGQQAWKKGVMEK